jgi:hypothetical protein
MNRSNTPITRVPQSPQSRANPTATSLDEHERGLPTWMTEPKTVFYAILIVMLLLSELYAGYLRRAMWAETKPSDTCITISTIAEKTEGNGWATRNAIHIKYLGSDTVSWSQHTDCTVETCTANYLKKTAERIDGYLVGRVHLLNAAHRGQGAEGVAIVDEALKQSQHYEIIRYARELIATKKISVENFSRVGQATYKLLIKHGNDNVPICYKPKKE